MTDKNVYLVTEGCYSSYKILGVFTRLAGERGAQEYAARAEGRSIETWTLDKPAGQVVRSGYEVYAYKLRRGGKSEWHIADRGWEEWDASRPDDIEHDTDGVEGFTILGRDRNYAYKIAQNKIAESKAREAGLT